MSLKLRRREETGVLHKGKEEACSIRAKEQGCLRQRNGFSRAEWGQRAKRVMAVSGVGGGLRPPASSAEENKSPSPRRKDTFRDPGFYSSPFSFLLSESPNRVYSASVHVRMHVCTRTYVRACVHACARAGGMGGGHAQRAAGRTWTPSFLNWVVSRHQPRVLAVRAPPARAGGGPGRRGIGAVGSLALAGSAETKSPRPVPVYTGNSETLPGSMWATFRKL